MASGTPLIVSDTGGLVEIVHNGVNGCTFPAGNSEVLAEQIIQLFEQPVYASKLADSASRTLYPLYDWAQIGSRTTHVYETVIANLAISTSVSP
ncbi:D-inositol-3-phosphate glycosyltransferase [compost metagenome]